MQVTLRSDAWHARLQMYIFGGVELKPNLCPYFWITVFCVIALPFSFCAQSIIRVVDVLRKTRKKEFVIRDMYIAYYVMKSIDTFNLYGFNCYGRPRVIYKQVFTLNGLAELIHALESWKLANPGWQKLFEEHAKELEEAYAKALDYDHELFLRDAKKKEERQRLMDRAGFITKRVFLIIWYCFLGVLGVTSLYAAITLFLDGGLALIASVTLIFITAVIFLGMFACVLHAAVNALHPRMERQEGTQNILKLYIQASKEKLCPKIQWL